MTWIPAVLTALAVLPCQLAAQSLVRDINTSAVPDPSAFESVPMHMTGAGSLGVFAAFTPDAGSEPWVSDGTTAGTRRLADIVPGTLPSRASGYTALPSGLFVFSAPAPDTGGEPWITDGTPAGTRLLADLRPGPASSTPFLFTAFGGEVYFLASSSGSRMFWRTDGTTAGTVPAFDLGGASAFEAVAVGGQLFLIADNRSANKDEIWVSDGTAGGTRMLAQISSIASQSPSRAYGSKLVFEANDNVLGREPWISDGTVAGTFPLGDLNLAGNARPFDFFELNGTCFFTAEAVTNVRELWSTDGTPAGTQQLTTALIPGDPDTSILGQVAGELVFSVGQPAVGGGLYRTDGTVGGEVLIGAVYPPCAMFCGVGAPTGSVFSAQLGNLLVFTGRSDADPDTELWMTDGVALTRVELATGSASSFPNGFASVGSDLIFAADSPATGRELFITDGTVGGTRLLADIQPAPISQGSSPFALGKLKDQLFFLADDGTTGAEPWVTDGTLGGTQLLLDIAPGSGAAGITRASFAVTDRFVFFSANTVGKGREPWVSDGTTAGTNLLLDVLAGAAWSHPRAAEAVGELVYFDATDGTHGRELWVTDGSAGGTRLVVDLYPAIVDSSPADLFAFGDRLLFTAEAPGTGRELFLTDGTAAGTVFLGDLNPGPESSSPAGLTRFGPHVYFSATDGNSGRELWRTDGTPSGTKQLLDLTPGSAGSAPRQLTVAGERLFFLAQEISGVQTKLWSYVAQGAQFVATLPFSVNGPLQAVGQAVYFFELVPFQGSLLWRSDGTSAGTQMIGAGSYIVGTSAKLWSPGIDNLWFRGSDRITGSELWLTDGTPGSEHLLVDLAPADSTPRDVVRVGSRVLFVADDGVHGEELHAVELASTDDWSWERYGAGCPGSNGSVPSIVRQGEARVGAGAPFKVSVVDALPSSAAFLLIAPSRTDIALGACALWVGPSFTIKVTPTDANGRGSIPLRASPPLVGSTVYFQYGVFDPGGAWNGIASTTGGLEVVIGP